MTTPGAGSGIPSGNEADQSITITPPVGTSTYSVTLSDPLNDNPLDSDTIEIEVTALDVSEITFSVESPSELPRQGRIDIDGDGIDETCADISCPYDIATGMSLNVSAYVIDEDEREIVFERWEGAGCPLSTSTETLTADSDMECRAVFVEAILCTPVPDIVLMVDGMPRTGSVTRAEILAGRVSLSGSGSVGAPDPSYFWTLSNPIRISRDEVWVLPTGLNRGSYTATLEFGCGRPASTETATFNFDVL